MKRISQAWRQLTIPNKNGDMKKDPSDSSGHGAHQPQAASRQLTHQTIDLPDDYSFNSTFGNQSDDDLISAALNIEQNIPDVRNEENESVRQERAKQAEPAPKTLVQSEFKPPAKKTLSETGSKMTLKESKNFISTTMKNPQLKVVEKKGETPEPVSMTLNSATSKTGQSANGNKSMTPDIMKNNRTLNDPNFKRKEINPNENAPVLTNTAVTPCQSRNRILTLKPRNVTNVTKSDSDINFDTAIQTGSRNMVRSHVRLDMLDSPSGSLKSPLQMSTPSTENNTKTQARGQEACPVMGNLYNTTTTPNRPPNTTRPLRASARKLQTDTLHKPNLATKDNDTHSKSTEKIPLKEEGLGCREKNEASTPSKTGREEVSPKHSASHQLTESQKSMLSMSAWGLPGEVEARYKEAGIEEMFPWQVECLCTRGVLDGGNLVYSAPTSAGKTLVAEILLLKRVLETKKKAIVILPFVSVAREKTSNLQHLFDPVGVKVEGFMGGRNPAGGFAAVDVAICTIEKANSLINRLLNEGDIDKLGVVVVDELHMVGDEHRGYLLELLLTKVRYMTSPPSPAHSEQDQLHSENSPSVQIIGMSATLPNLDLLGRWLNATVYVTDFRPIPLTESVKIGSIIYDKNMTKLRDLCLAAVPMTGDEGHVLSLCLETLNCGRSVLIFCPTKNWCEKLAMNLAGSMYNLNKKAAQAAPANIGRETGGVKMDRSALRDVIEQLRRTPIGLDRMLAQVVPQGVAFHHAGLTFDERDIVESAFRQGSLRVLVATSTLSSGVNLPARRVIIRTPIFHGHLIDTRTYKQMVGRAGRKGVDTEGDSVLVCKESERSKASSLLSSNLPPVHSCLLRHQTGDTLSSSMKRAILEVVVSGVARSPRDVQTYASCTMLAADGDQSLPGCSQKLIDSCIKFLADSEFILLKKSPQQEEDVYEATLLGKGVLSSALSPDEGLIVFSELQRARRNFVLENELHIIYQVTPIYQVCTTIDWYHYMCLYDGLSPGERRVADCVGVSENYLARCVQGRVPSSTPAQQRSLGIHRRFYTALVLQELVQETPLARVADKYHVTRGVLQSLQQAAATFAGMVTAFCSGLGWANLELLLAQFQARLSFGIQRELTDLVRISLLNAHRARSLYNAGFYTVAALANAPPHQVEALLRASVPFHSKRRAEDETEWERSERQKVRCISVSGQKGLSEAEAAVMIIDDARRLVEADLGVEGIKWTRRQTQDNCVSSKASVPETKTRDLTKNVKEISNQGKIEKVTAPEQDASRPVGHNDACDGTASTNPALTTSESPIENKTEENQIGNTVSDINTSCNIKCPHTQRKDETEHSVTDTRSNPKTSIVINEAGTKDDDEKRKSETKEDDEKDTKEPTHPQLSNLVNGEEKSIEQPTTPERCLIPVGSDKCQELNTSAANVSNDLYSEQIEEAQTVEISEKIDQQNVPKPSTSRPEIKEVEMEESPTVNEAKNMSKQEHILNVQDTSCELYTEPMEEDFNDSFVFDTQMAQLVSETTTRMEKEPYHVDKTKREKSMNSESEKAPVKHVPTRELEQQPNQQLKELQEWPPTPKSPLSEGNKPQKQKLSPEQQIQKDQQKEANAPLDLTLDNDLELFMDEFSTQDIVNQNKINAENSNHTKEPQNEVNHKTNRPPAPVHPHPTPKEALRPALFTSFSESANLDTGFCGPLHLELSSPGLTDSVNIISDEWSDSEFSPQVKKNSSRLCLLQGLRETPRLTPPSQRRQNDVIHTDVTQSEELAYVSLLHDTSNIPELEDEDDGETEDIQNNNKSPAVVKIVNNEMKSNVMEICENVNVTDKKQDKDAHMDLSQYFADNFGSYSSCLNDSWSILQNNTPPAAAKKLPACTAVTAPSNHQSGMNKTGAGSSGNQKGSGGRVEKGNVEEVEASTSHGRHITDVKNDVNEASNTLQCRLMAPARNQKNSEISNKKRKGEDEAILNGTPKKQRRVFTREKDPVWSREGGYGEERETMKGNKRGGEMYSPNTSDLIPPTPPSADTPKNLRKKSQHTQRKTKGSTKKKRLAETGSTKKGSKNDTKGKRSHDLEAVIEVEKIPTNPSEENIIDGSIKKKERRRGENGVTVSTIGEPSTRRWMRSQILTDPASPARKATPKNNNRNINKMTEKDTRPPSPNLSQLPPLTHENFTIVDVAASRMLFEHFLSEWKQMAYCGISLACEHYTPPHVPTTPHTKPLIIGAQFMTGSNHSTTASSHTAQVSNRGLPVHGTDLCLVGIAISWANRDAYYVSLTDQEETEDLDESLSPPPHDPSLLAGERLQAVLHVLAARNKTHTVMFDMKDQINVLARATGGQVRGQMKDPKVAAWLLDSASKEMSLHRMVQNKLPLDTYMLEGLGGGIGLTSLGLSPENPGSARVRACIEAVAVRRLMVKLEEEMAAAHLLPSFTEVEMPTQVILSHMELNGFGFSEVECEHQRRMMMTRLEELEEAAYLHAARPFSLTSPDDIAQVLFIELKLPPSGDPANPMAGCKTLGPARGRRGKRVPFSTAKEVLEKLKPLHPLPALVLEWRRISMALTKVVSPLTKEKVRSEVLQMFRIFSVSQTHTATGRVSMSEPNLQNIPKDFEIDLSVGPGGAVRESSFSVSMRHAFIPYKGGIILAADYSQLELRIIAHLSGDQRLKAILNTGSDVFKQIAAEWKGLDIEQVTDQHRQQAKQVCYGMLYGIGPKALGDQLSVSEEDASIFMETFKEKYRGLRTFLRSCVSRCRELGYVETVYHRRRYLPAIRDNNLHAKAHAERQAVNTTVQGSAADLVKVAMVKIEENLTANFPHAMPYHQHIGSNNGVNEQCVTPRAYLLLQLHDELIFEVNSDILHQVAYIIKETMETAMSLDVQLPVKVKCGPSWGRLTEMDL